ncbi:putative AAA+ ATPase domain, ATPase, AAA-type, core, katanin p60 ATPase-containing subunit A-like 2 [Plasmopara halstedii]
MSTLMHLKAQNESRLAEEKRMIDRRRSLLVMILQHCTENGYLQTAEKLQQEAGVALSKYEVVENLDLLRIVQEYEDFQEIKFGKRPILVRRSLSDEQNKGNDKKAAAAAKRARRNDYTSTRMPMEARVENNAGLRAIHNKTSIAAHTSSGNPLKAEQQVPDDTSNADFGLVGQRPAQNHTRHSKSGNGLQRADNQQQQEENSYEEHLLKPFPSFALDSELRPIAETITREIFQKNPDVRWNNVVGLVETKRLLKEAVVMPLKYPQLFQGLLSPWTGILLYGPPGNGKTMLAKAVATECRTTFFNISASSIISKYRGDSEKLIRMLFDLARHHAPSTIFLDEIDSIMGQRDSGGGQEHEASRRMKTELLIQMDGLAKTDDVIFVLAASNLPWDLDAAMLRRLEKRVLVDLPPAEARHALFASLLEPYTPKNSFSFDEAVRMTEGYSGADIKLVAKETCMAPVRRLLAKLESDDNDEVVQRSSNQSHEASAEDWRELLGDVKHEDLLAALQRTKPSAQFLLEKYQQWQSTFGST